MENCKIRFRTEVLILSGMVNVLMYDKYAVNSNGNLLSGVLFLVICSLDIFLVCYHLFFYSVPVTSI